VEEVVAVADATAAAGRAAASVAAAEAAAVADPRLACLEGKVTHAG
jgi:hypothetical protein